MSLELRRDDAEARLSTSVIQSLRRILDVVSAFQICCLGGLLEAEFLVDVGQLLLDL